MTVDEIVERFASWARTNGIARPSARVSFDDWFAREWKGIVNRYAAADQAARVAIADLPLDQQKLLVSRVRSVLRDSA